MKKIIDKNTRLIIRSKWLIRHRWYAVIIVILMSAIAKLSYSLDLDSFGIFLISIILIIENFICFYGIKKIEKNTDKIDRFKKVKRNINLQISVDLILLTYLIHSTGGIDSPFIAAYFFHMVISSILLSQKETFIQTSFAVVLLTTVTFLEYSHIIDHYCICYNNINQPESELYFDTFYYLKTLCAFVVSFYILAYISSAIGKRLRKQEEHYANAIILLNKKDKIKNEYVLRLTHDIKGHISAIQSSLSVVKTGIYQEIHPKNKEFIIRAYKRTKALINFIKDLLRLTKMRQDDQFEQSTFFFKNMLYECLDDVKSTVDTKSIRLLSDVDETIADFKGDEFSLKEITTNMILNAVKYTPENGEIRLEAYDLDDKIRVVISDSGIGVPEDDIPFIFEEFYRGSNVDKQKIEGTGVGLAIAKNVISNHKGKIWVENRPEGGASFIYEIPK